MRRAAAVALVAAVAALAFAVWPREDDRPVDASRPDAQRAIAAALEIVPGRVLGVARDVDNGKWEVTITQDEREYEVELAPADLTLLRLDYD